MGPVAWTVVGGLFLLTGGWIGTRTAWRARRGHPMAEPDGWVYFLSAPNRYDAPIKIGSTKRDPTQDRLPEIRTMSPFPLKVIYKFRAPDVHAAERACHKHLADYRLHGEWFDRDATLAFIDHLKGEV